MTDDELDAVSRRTCWRPRCPASGRTRRRRDELDLLAVDAAGGVDVGGRLLGALLELCAEGGVRAGQRAGNADQDLRPGGAGECDNARSAATADKKQFLHL